MIPAFKRIVVDKKLTEYILILGFLINFLIPTIIGIVRIINPYFGQTGLDLLDLYNISIITGYPIYFLLGKYIDEYGLPWKTSVIIILCIVGFCASVLGDLLMSYLGKNDEIWFCGNLTIFVFFQSLCIFVIAKKICSDMKPSKLSSFIAKNTFGIYLIHYLFTQILGKYVLHVNITVFVLFIFVSAVIIYILSLIISALLKKIPLLSRIV